ncbi:MAG: hypothetical protein HC824_15845 [Synechococcales cyanobacterium RM1_1_8]|nr:hypothetical protein [Synechococcales cyanobacterium RM1_1_8]
MKPKINDPQTWSQAELLMQPAFIRLIDNVRKAVEATDWESRYETLQVWPEAATAVQKARWEVLTAQLETTQPVDLGAVEAELATLPRPELFYRLYLEWGDRQAEFDLWQLCYQVCFRDYEPDLPTDSAGPLAAEIQAVEIQAVEIDDRLLDPQGEIDWVALDQKTKGIINQIIAGLA